MDGGAEVAPVIQVETERGFAEAVIEMARLLGWRVAHFRPARTLRGWRTAVEGDGVGFPDLVLVRPPRLIAAELKSARGRLTAEQGEWLRLLSAAGVETHIWRPADWDDVEEALR